MSPRAASLATLTANHPGIWKGIDLSRPVQPGLRTGFPALDAELPGKGWPRGALTEILASQTGFGQFSLLLPALAAASRESWIALISPPHHLHAPALAMAGIDPARLLIVFAKDKESFWACEQILRAGCFAAVIAWLPEIADMQKALRRLQLAAEGRATSTFVFRPAKAAANSSPAALRLLCEPMPGGIAVRLLKRRGGPLATPITLSPNHHPASRHALARPALSATAARSAASPAFAT